MQFFEILDDGALNKCGIVNADDLDLDEVEPITPQCKVCETDLDEGRCSNEECSEHRDEEW